MLAGAGYAAVMLHGLRTWWVKAVTTPFLVLHTTWTSFGLGFASSMVVGFATIGWTLWRMRDLAVRRLLAGQAAEAALGNARTSRAGRYAPLAALGLAVILTIAAFSLGGAAQSGLFFGSGFALLGAALGGVWNWLRQGQAGGVVSTAPWPLVRLAARNAARHSNRSALTIGLVAAATFLIVALSVFQIDPSGERPDLRSGNGGFALVAESGTPIVEDINLYGRLTALQPDEQQRLRGVTTYACRVQPGDDASCRNLYRVARPRVLGMPREFLRRGGFAWSASLAQTEQERGNPWRLLDRPARSATSSGELQPSAVPVVLDANTAQWSLHLGGNFASPLGATFTIRHDQGNPIELKVVGLLSGSIFQGDVLMGEADFLACFPGISGKSFFLVEVPDDLTQDAPADAGVGPVASFGSTVAEADAASAAPNAAAPAVAASRYESRVVEVRRLLEKALGSYGFDAESSGNRLAGFLAVQNTYLATFQSLGALGLLLGTFGLATVQLRSVLERQGELALLQAIGFARRRVALLVLAENAVLLVGGLGVGTLSALAAVLPHLWVGGAHVPLGYLAIRLGGILCIGVAAGLTAVRSVLRSPLIPALRGTSRPSPIARSLRSPTAEPWNVRFLAVVGILTSAQTWRWPATRW